MPTGSAAYQQSEKTKRFFLTNFTTDPDNLPPAMSFTVKSNLIVP